MTRKEFADTVNNLGASAIPFLFITDFELEDLRVIPLARVNQSEILFDIRGKTNYNEAPAKPLHSPLIRSKEPEDREEYRSKFNFVYERLKYGDSFLTNLTTRTGIELTHSLREIFFAAHAPYKLLFEDRFLVFSPESFVRISNGRIFSFPMKGTIDAAVPDAAAKILADPKELAEHITIVDLIRNDLSQVAGNVHVSRFRYIDEIKTTGRTLLQVSSRIEGELSGGFERKLGDILLKLLPAGSVSGAPKPQTLKIIRAAERVKRGYYTGVFGYFNGRELDSGVMIRFMEKEGDRFYYRSGGGITTQSNADNEYEETIAKVYVPVN